jgi:signal peptidase I
METDLLFKNFQKTGQELRGKDYIPQRYEIVVFDKPSFLSGSSGEVDHLIKRVIGLPGERVVLNNGRYTVYNVEKPEGFNPDEGQEYAKDIINTPGAVDITVGQKEIFVSGDNRSNSLDSRNFGAVNTNSVTGVATLRFVPVDAFQRL